MEDNDIAYIFNLNFLCDALHSKYCFCFGSTQLNRIRAFLFRFLKHLMESIEENVCVLLFENESRSKTYSIFTTVADLDSCKRNDKNRFRYLVDTLNGYLELTFLLQSFDDVIT